MTKKVQGKNRLIVKTTRAKSPTTVPFESGFRFYTTVGNYAGVTATNLNEFTGILQTIPIESITFHFQRKDFQHWINDTLKDTELAGQMNTIKQGLSAEDLRKEILTIVKARAV